MARITIKDLSENLNLKINNLKMVKGGFIQTYFTLYPSTEDWVYKVKFDDQGKTILVFGDGVRGARPPSGSDNIAASYGSDGSKE